MPTLISDARRASGLSQSQVALLAGTSRPNISAYEHGHRSPTLDTLERLLAANGQHLVAVPLPNFTQYWDRRGKPFFVPDQLPQLPPATALATVILPLHVDWSTPGKRRDLSDRQQRMLAYQILLSEGEPSDIVALVDGNLLIDIWAEVHLPEAIRSAWQPLIERTFSSEAV